MLQRLVLVLIACFLLSTGRLSGQDVYNPTPDWVSSDEHYSTGAALADMDRDGWLDLVVSNGNDMAIERVAVYYNNGDGTFPSYPNWSSQDKGENGHLDVADVNGDGWPDVAVARLVETSSGSCAARVYLNNNGTLSSLPDWTSAEDARAFGVAFGDINNDGRPDLAVATGWAYSPQKKYKDYVYLNVNGQLQQSAFWESNDINTDQGVLWVDADDDGWLDLAATGAGKNTRVYRNTGGTLTGSAAWSAIDGSNQDAIMLAWGDVTQEGFRDLFVADNNQLPGGSGKFRRYDGLAGGYFETSESWSYYDGMCSAVALADVNSDGALDLAVGGWWDYTRIFLNNGHGLKRLPDWNSQGTSVKEKIVFGDIDPDAHTVKTVQNLFPPAGGRQLFHLTRRQIQGVNEVVLDGVALGPSQYMVNRECGWITVCAAPAVMLKVRFDYSVSLDMAITNWDSDEGNYLYYNQLEPGWLKADATELSAASGGTVGFSLNAGMEWADRHYFLLGGVSGTEPGFALPGGKVVLPLNWDFFTGIVFALANTPYFADFHGQFDGSGCASAEFDTYGPLSPQAVGVVICFSYLLYSPYDFVSNPVEVEIVP